MPKNARTLVPEGKVVAMRGRRRGRGKPSDAAQLVKRFEAAAAGRDLWASYWRECYEFALPHRNLFSGQAAGAKKDGKVFDSTAVEAVQSFASELSQALIPPFRRWVRLVAGTDVPEEHRAEINLALDKETEVLFQYLDHSNLATESHEALLDLAVGTGALQVQDSGDDTNPLRFTAVPLAQLVVEEGPMGTVETVFREYSMPARNVQRTWPQARVSDALASLIERNGDERVGLIEGTVYDPEGGYRYVVIEREGNHLAVDSFLDDSPWVIFRWMVVTGEKYGRGPLMSALPDIKTANKVVELVLRNAALAVSAPMLAVDDGILNAHSIRLRPGAIIPVLNPDSLRPLELGGNFDVSELVLNDLRQSIREKLYVQELPPLEGQPRTATELQIRNQQLLRRIGSSFGRLQHELVFSVIRGALKILQRRGKMAPIKLDGREVDVEFRGQLAQVQDQQDVMVLESFLQIVGALGPEVTAGTSRIEDIPEYVAGKLGVPQELVRSKAEREKIKQEMAQAAQQQQAEAAALSPPATPAGTGPAILGAQPAIPGEGG